jgi:hypothetical protein
MGAALSVWVYVRCPACGRRLKEPFVRAAVPVVNSHRHAEFPQQRCRIVVTPDVRGEAHRIVSVPEGESFEQVLAREAGRAA